ncbi:hypothetical protein JCM10049v2_001243 [Rhodotorula toruloides]
MHDVQPSPVSAMSIASLVPDVSCDPLVVADLLPEGLRGNMLYPYCAFFAGVVPPRPGCPPWTAELEARYQSIHPLVWHYLWTDDFIDRSAVTGLRARIAAAESQQGESRPTGEASLEDLRTALGIVRQRRSDRLGSLLALDVVRTRYIDCKLREEPNKNQAQVLADLPRSGSAPPAVAAPHSLWPIYAPPPYPGLICLWDDVNWTRYRFPDCPAETADIAPKEPRAAPSCSPAGVVTLPTSSFITSSVEVSATGLRRRR